MSENPIINPDLELVLKDIKELQDKIDGFKSGTMHEERFKHFRLTRGVYGQRQLGVHMFRTKIPYGKLTAAQLSKLADVSEKYTNGNLHLTTRQNIQMHYVKIDDAVDIWKDLAEVGVTAREACGNTVRNLTASAMAGIDPDEPFDVTPYVHAMFEYFLRNPICQDMGRKIKPAFSSSDKDSAFTYFHDFGFIPRIKIENGQETRGFKVVIAGGLGAQSIVAKTAYEFLHEDKIIPFTEAAIRVFDRFGEREKRFKARMKFLIKTIGMEKFMELVEQEMLAVANTTLKINRQLVPQVPPAIYDWVPTPDNVDQNKFELWKLTNVTPQKQTGYFAVKIKVPLGDISAERARAFAALVKSYAADDIRITVNQGFLLRFVKEEVLEFLYIELLNLGLGDPGFESMADITACPGTDTCNLAVTNSTALATALEEVIFEEYPHLIRENNLSIKISGCMNSCGQHMAASIGLHGSSIKVEGRVAPAMQIVIGGGVDAAGIGHVADKVIKLPTKRIPDAVRIILDDYESTAADQDFITYAKIQGKRYFYDLLKSLSHTGDMTDQDFNDWGQNHSYRQAIGVGECAGVAYDMVGAIVNDSLERLAWGKEAINQKAFADSLYHSYAAMVIGAKALLLADDIKCNTHKGIIADFDTHYVNKSRFKLSMPFADQVLAINKCAPSEQFATTYYTVAEAFVQQMLEVRKKQLLDSDNDKEVISKYYNA
ncbi:MAG: nitrite/sulfite reductase [Bacteroidia bacterium]|nr:nitrite/sulfite reductase [Bacteroidia bacterium]